MESPEIRAKIIKDSDLVEVIRVIASWKGHPHWSYGPHLWGDEFLQSEIRTSTGYGLFLRDSLVAFIFIKTSGDICEITALASDCRQVRRGHMAALLADLSQLCPKNIKEIWLEVHEDNTAAFTCYTKHGFQITGRRPRYYGNNKAAILLTHFR